MHSKILITVSLFTTFAGLAFAQTEHDGKTFHWQQWVDHHRPTLAQAEIPQVPCPKGYLLRNGRCEIASLDYSSLNELSLTLPAITYHVAYATVESDNGTISCTLNLKTKAILTVGKEITLKLEGTNDDHLLQWNATIEPEYATGTATLTCSAPDTAPASDVKATILKLQLATIQGGEAPAAVRRDKNAPAYLKTLRMDRE